MVSELIDLNQAKQQRTEVDQWVHAAQSGDIKAFEQLYRHFERRIYALCLRMVANESIAQELMQEAFVLAWRKLQMFHGESQFGTWLHRLTTNLVISFFRSNKNKEFDGIDSDLVSGSHESKKLDLNRDLDTAISELPDKARMVLVLHDIEGYKHNEIAEKMSISEGTSKAQLHRARKLLKARLE
ncbi:MAG: sigma-70 family RNA polymerase sigma factor [Gammaproteobacteria bacterium]|nr:sigma-70 family RNA polymerase sigma factor [Gammaproteobacteria bacterium]